MRASGVAVLLGVATVAGCGDDAKITIDAPNHTVAAYENGTWWEIAMHDGVGEYTPSGQFAIAALCNVPENEILEVPAHIVLGGPGDVTEIESSCRADRPLVNGTLEIVGATSAMVFVGDRSLQNVQGQAPASLPAGRQDIVATDTMDHRWLLVRDVDLADGFHVRLDFSSPTAMFQRPGADQFVLETKNGTSMLGEGDRAFASDELVRGDRQSVLYSVADLAFIRLAAGPDARAGEPVTDWVPSAVSDIHVLAGGGRVDARWTSTAPWTKRTISFDSFRTRWTVEAYDGWNGVLGGELHVPNLTSHPGWRAQLELSSLNVRFELAERLDDVSEGVVYAAVRAETPL